MDDSVSSDLSRFTWYANFLLSCLLTDTQGGHRREKHLVIASHKSWGLNKPDLGWCVPWNVSFFSTCMHSAANSDSTTSVRDTPLELFCNCSSSLHSVVGWSSPKLKELLNLWLLFMALFASTFESDDESLSDKLPHGDDWSFESLDRWFGSDSEELLALWPLFILWRSIPLLPPAQLCPSFEINSDRLAEMKACNQQQQQSQLLC